MCYNTFFYTFLHLFTQLNTADSELKRKFYSLQAIPSPAVSQKPFVLRELHVYTCSTSTLVGMNRLDATEILNFYALSITSNLWTHVWSIKYR
jgi:hypothetical protein